MDGSTSRRRTTSFLILKIKPLSVNQAYKGRKFRTSQYDKYISEVTDLLKGSTFDFYGKLHLDIEFGFSSKASDIDNPVKCFVDCLQKHFGFNDKMIYSMSLKKVDVKKGCEYIDFNIENYEKVR